jgi:uncharacterized membrane protein
MVRRLHNDVDGRLLLLAAALCAFWSFALPARAEFDVCNQTLDVVNVAIGQSAGEQFRTEGWWTIGSNQCATVIRDELVNRYIYVYAIDVFGQPILEGSVDMCIGTRRFAILGIDSCWQRGHSQGKFLEVDTQAVERWTLFLTDALAATPGEGQ